VGSGSQGQDELSTPSGMSSPIRMGGGACRWLGSARKELDNQFSMRLQGRIVGSKPVNVLSYLLDF
jgi:hypothetical protein